MESGGLNPVSVIVERQHKVANRNQERSDKMSKNENNNEPRRCPTDTNRVIAVMVGGKPIVVVREDNDCTCEKCGGDAPAVLHTDTAVVEFKNHVGDGPSGFDRWHDTKWCC